MDRIATLAIKKRSVLAFCDLLLKKEQQAIPDELILDFNIDGVKHSKSTKDSLWIIQMSSRNFTLDPFVIGTFSGREKPDCNILFNDFVNEINESSKCDCHITNYFDYSNLEFAQHKCLDM